MTASGHEFVRDIVLESAAKAPMPRPKSEPRKSDPFLKGSNLRKRAAMMEHVASLMSGRAKDVLTQKAVSLRDAADTADAPLLRTVQDSISS